MGVAYSKPSSQLHTATANANQNLTGDWAISFWIDAPASLPYNETPVAEKFSTGPNNAFVVWIGNGLGGAGYLALETYNAGSGGFNEFTNAGYDILGAGLKHILIAKTAADGITAWVNGVSYESLSGVTMPGTSTGNLVIGAAPVGYSRYLTSTLSDFRIYNSRSHAAAAMAKIIYEAQGRDGITEGLQVWYPMFGTGGTVAASLTDLSPNAIAAADTNDPTFVALPLRA